MLASETLEDKQSKKHHSNTNKSCPTRTSQIMQNYFIYTYEWAVLDSNLASVPGRKNIFKNAIKLLAVHIMRGGGRRWLFHLPGSITDVQNSLIWFEIYWTDLAFRNILLIALPSWIASLNDIWHSPIENQVFYIFLFGRNCLKLSIGFQWVC